MKGRTMTDEEKNEEYPEWDQLWGLSFGSNWFYRKIDETIEAADNNRFQGAVGNHFGHGCWIRVEMTPKRDRMRVWGERRNESLEVLATSKEWVVERIKDSAKEWIVENFEASALLDAFEGVVKELYP